MVVFAADVAAFLGKPGDAATVALADQHLPLVTAMVASYTRGHGFTDGDPADDLAAVIICATARLMANPEQLAYDTGSVSVRGGFSGWTLAETYVLNRYRKRSL